MSGPYKPSPKGPVIPDLSKITPPFSGTAASGSRPSVMNPTSRPGESATPQPRSAPTWEQLIILRETLGKFGVLHEANVQQLKYWPILAFPYLSKWSTSVDQDNQIVYIEGTPGPNPPPKDMKHRLDLLIRSIKDMLGDVWRIKIVVSGKVIYGEDVQLAETRDEITPAPKKRRTGSKSNSKR